jgi:bifunctional DNA-binding transcriptional regulator/antitoxin component of YhaV-PrlF toxin-antitoxin module
LSILELDDKGRLTIPKQFRESLEIGRKVLIINAGDHLKIIPLPSDPFKTLHGAFNIKKSFRELRKQAELIGENDEGSIGGLKRDDQPS